MVNFMLMSLLITAEMSRNIEALECYSCVASYTNNDDVSCRRPILNKSTTCNSPYPTSYCATTVVLTNGQAVISRSCEVHSSSSVTSGEWCSSVLRSSGDVDKTTCRYTCTSDSCNNQKTIDLIPCVDCVSNRGSCDVLTGKCSCRFGYTGTSCQNEVPTTTTTTTPKTTAPFVQTTSRKCVQCNSETDAHCSQTTTATACEIFNNYCSTAQSWQINSTGGIEKKTITRGCTSSYLTEDRCEIVSLYSSSYGLTCYSTCTSDGCNTNFPDGFKNNDEKRRLSCVVCSGTSCSTESSRSLCSSVDTHCYTKVKYVMMRENELNYDDALSYKLLHLERGCSSIPLVKQCNSTQVGKLSLDRIECQESCDIDGCNTGWPNRPKCMQCSSGCVPTTCSGPHKQYCVFMDKYRTSGGNYKAGYPSHSTNRFCSSIDYGTSCRTFTLHTETFQDCNRTCTEDGCNAGNSASAQHLSVLVLASTILAMTGYMAV